MIFELWWQEGDRSGSIDGRNSFRLEIHTTTIHSPVKTYTLSVVEKEAYFEHVSLFYDKALMRVIFVLHNLYLYSITDHV